jgi:hypothetical protein
LAPEPFYPEVARAVSKAARQEIGDGIKIGRFYLAASNHAPNPVLDSIPLVRGQVHGPKY